MKIKFMLEDGAFAPEKAHDTDAGFDIRTPEFVIVNPRSSVFVDTKLHVFIPEGYCGVLISKSGLNKKHGINVVGLIDALYTGSIGCKIYNHSDSSHSFNIGDKITQLMILPVPEVEMEETNIIPTTERGDGGFGSSGR